MIQLVAGSQSAPWGAEDRHYAASTGAAMRAAQLASEHDAKRWAKALDAASPGVRDAVERAYRRWNSAIRDCLRNETALRLSAADEVQSVPVKIVEGMPALFADVLRQFEGLEWLLLNRAALDAAITGTGFMEAGLPDARDAWAKQAGPADAADIRRVHDTARAWLNHLDTLQALDRLIGIREDVLGAYYFRIPEVRLYWVVIGITAQLLGVSAEALTIVVLAHELAHAYTHLGLDIDNERWDTERFARAELEIVEGLAQFYTEIVCGRLEHRMPSALEAYKVLLKRQSAPHRAHLGWMEDKGRSAEIIRVSMLEFRSKGHTSSADFAEAVRRYREGVRGK